jgi:guanylate kinase
MTLYTGKMVKKINPQLANKLSNYQPSEEVVDLVRKTPIVFVVGFTGAGKDALQNVLLTTGKYHRIVSHTTRSPRVNQGVMEQEGVEYHFIDMDTAESMIDEGAFVEVKTYSDNVYGTSAQELKDARQENKILLGDIEVQGISEYKAIDPSVKAVFVLPPSFDVWQKRLHNRTGKSMEPDEYKRRMETAIMELEQLLTTVHFVCIINDDLQTAAGEIDQITSTGHENVVNDQLARTVAEKFYTDIQKKLAELE